MGYYTSFSLTISQMSNKPLSEEDCKFLSAELQRMNVFEYGRYDDPFLSSFEAYATKWYECEEDMKLLSSKFPTLLFTLDGHGEDSEDIWVAYFMDGREQFAKAQIVYEEFNKRKLGERIVPKQAQRYSYQEDDDGTL